MKRARRFALPATAPRKNRRRLGRRGGFSLLEMLIALAIAAIAIAVVGPNISAGLNRAGYYAAAAQLDRELLRLRRRAFDEEIEIRLRDPAAPAAPAARGIGRRDASRETARDASGKRERAAAETVALSLAGGWRYELSGAIIFFPNGQCRGAPVRLTGGGRAVDLGFDVQRCRLTQP